MWDIKICKNSHLMERHGTLKVVPSKTEIRQEQYDEYDKDNEKNVKFQII